MFWQYENGKLLNLNAVELIYFDPVPYNGEYRVMATRLGKKAVDLYSSKDKEHVQQVLRKIGAALDRQESLISEVYAKRV